MGAHTRALDTALNVAEQYDVQVALHTDGLNECLSVDDTLRVLAGPNDPRVPHRGLRRRARAQRVEARRRAERDRVEHQPDVAVRARRARRALRDDLRRARSEPSLAQRSPPRDRSHPRRHHGRRGRAARSRRHRHHVERCAGHGPRRRDGAPHVPTRGADEAPADPRQIRTTARPVTTTTGSASTSPSSPSTRRSPTA